MLHYCHDVNDVRAMESAKYLRETAVVCTNQLAQLYFTEGVELITDPETRAPRQAFADWKGFTFGQRVRQMANVMSKPDGQVPFDYNPNLYIGSLNNLPQEQRVELYKYKRELLAPGTTSEIEGTAASEFMAALALVITNDLRADDPKCKRLKLESSLLLSPDTKWFLPLDEPD